MRVWAFVAAAAAIVAPTGASAAVTYTFATTEPFAGGALEFTVETDAFVGEEWIQRAALKNASTAIQRVRFEATCPDGGGTSACDQVSIVASTGFGSTVVYRYFNDGAFAEAGSYQSKNTSTAATLTVSRSLTPAVPEPGTWLTMLLGFGLIGFALRRRTILRFT
ncbi:PEPxxWA-CTERM sorting domain-containing protein [uncultured Sphingomonas sp.]|uniref:PEPxxWA-CTERM sorting domain-containing protein n=1 Tax=uncultured Sphingomonas sp. TaxID=158754 RepID=UPI0030F56D69